LSAVDLPVHSGRTEYHVLPPSVEYLRRSMPLRSASQPGLEQR
jgi:hypothetical protein